MAQNNPILPPGYSDAPPGHVVSVVTCLEMRARPALADAPLPEGVTLVPWTQPDLTAYRALFRKIGSDWLWYSRLIMDDAQLRVILDDPHTAIFVLRKNDRDVGFLELDFSRPEECELSFLGLEAALTGKGLGSAVMKKALAMAWSRPIRRMWLHTCSFDHPSAVAFYIRHGFTPFAFQVEVQADPRLSGHLPRDAAPHVPVIPPR